MVMGTIFGGEGINMRVISQRGNQMDRGSLNLMVEKIKEPGKMTSK